MVKIKLEGVSETLLTCVYARYIDYNGDKILNDKISNDLVNTIDYDYSKCDNTISMSGCVARAYVIDQNVKEYIKNHPEAIIVSLGSGLDLRFNRVDNGKITFIDIDLPEVVEIRNELLPKHKRNIFLSYSIFDKAWVDKVKKFDLSKGLLFVSEGVFMYFDDNEVSKILSILTDNFDNFELYVDLISDKLVKHSFNHPVVKKYNAEFKSGSKDGRELLKLNNKIEFIDCISYTPKLKEILSDKKIGLARLFLPMILKMNNKLGKYKKA